MEKNLSKTDKVILTMKITKRLSKYCISRTKNRWQIVSFEGPKGGEPRGIVDIIAIRKNHKLSTSILKAGDLFDIVLIQAKGGSAEWPDEKEITRLLQVGKYYHAYKIVLANWKKGKLPVFYHRVKNKWQEINFYELFK